MRRRTIQIFNSHPLLFFLNRRFGLPAMCRNEAYIDMRSPFRWSRPGDHAIEAAATTMSRQTLIHDEAGFALKGVSR